MDKPTSYQVQTVLTGLSALTAVTGIAGQLWSQIKVNSGGNGWIGSGTSLLVGRGMFVGGATLPPIVLEGSGTFYLSSVGASCEFGIIRGLVVEL